jgi:hypothetical protein
MGTLLTFDPRPALCMVYDDVHSASVLRDSNLSYINAMTAPIVVPL